MANVEPCQCFGTTIKATGSIADSMVSKRRLLLFIFKIVCYAVFSVNPFSGQISKRLLVESLSLKTVIPLALYLKE